MARRKKKQTKNAETTTNSEEEARIREEKEKISRKLAEIYARYKGVNRTLRNLYADRKLIEKDQLEFLKKEQRKEFNQIISKLANPEGESTKSAKDAFLDKFGIAKQEKKKKR
jgi:pantothenate kinase